MATIIDTIPTSVRTPGAYSIFDFTSGAQPLVPLETRAAIIAEVTAAATAAIEVPIQIFSEADADVKAGQGSLAAILCRTAIAQGAQSGNTPEIWLVPIAQPGGGTAAVETITITVTTATAGTLQFTIAGRLFNVGISAGDSPTTIAAAIVAQIAAAKSLVPFTATSAAGVATCTFTTKGVNGNDAAFALVQAPAGVTVVFAQSVAGAGAASITNACNALFDKTYDAVAISNHTATDVTELLSTKADAWGYANRNYRFFFVGENGSLGTAQTLQAAANDFGIVFTSAEKVGSLPGELAVVTMIAEYSRDNPNANLAGELVLIYPPPAAFAYIGSEVESALSGGVTPLVPSGSWMKIVRLVTSEISINSAPFEPLRDIAYPRTAAYRARQYEFNYDAKFGQAIDTDDFKKQVRNMAIGVDRALEAAGILRDVNTFLGQFQVVDADAPAGRILTSAPFRPAGPVFQSVTRHTMYM